MRFLLDLAYVMILVVLSPWLLFKAIKTGKYRHGLMAKGSGSAYLRDGPRRCVWFHGVSVGEVHLLRQVVAAFRRRHPDWDCVVSTTTDTGLEEARKHFAGLPVFPWPLDFSWAVNRALGRVRPDLVVLGESELWPNFLAAAEGMAIPIVVINARMSPKSLRNYLRLGSLARRLIGQVSLFAAQTEEYGDHLRRLGARSVVVTGSVKYDGVNVDRGNPRTRSLGEMLQLTSDDQVLIAGSTQAPEEAIALEVFRQLKPDFPRLRLILVPRQKDRFEEVADLLRRQNVCFSRRSQLAAGAASEVASVVLVDTIGELGALWGLADIAFVGGSLDGHRGGQNMLEPAAYGAAVLFGPHVWNFRDAATRLLACGGALQVANGTEFAAVARRLLADPALRTSLGDAARAFVRSQQGATERTITLLERLMPQTGEGRHAA